jgi:hypothetical protein
VQHPQLLLKRHRCAVDIQQFAKTGAIQELLSPLLWNDLVTIVDDGRNSAPAYRELAQVTAALRAKYPLGYGVLIIIPRKARPPSDEARRAINTALAAATGGLKRLCWLVEGKGFQAAMARAVLTGLRILPRTPFDTAVKSELDEALEWLLTGLRDATANVEPEIAAARAYLCNQRLEY